MKRITGNWFGCIGILITIVMIGLLVRVDAQKVQHYVGSIPRVPAAIVFCVLYICATGVVWNMEDPLQIVGVVLFGPIGSAGIMFFSEAVVSLVLFWLIRVWGIGFVETKLRGKGARLFNACKNMNIWAAVFLRANPLVPLRVIDAAAGFSRLSLREYMAVVAVATLPRLLWVQIPLAVIQGRSFPEVLVYFQQHPGMLMFEVIYLITVIIGAVYAIWYTRRRQVV